MIKKLKYKKLSNTKVIMENTTDKGWGVFYKNEKGKCFSFLADTVVVTITIY